MEEIQSIAKLIVELDNFPDPLARTAAQALQALSDELTKTRRKLSLMQKQEYLSGDLCVCGEELAQTFVCPRCTLGRED